MHILQDSGRYFFFNALNIEKTLAPKNYLFNFDTDTGNCWLEDLEDFKFPDKVYDVDKHLRELAKISFHSYQKNMGILLTGNKGQGKSLTAKLVCKDMDIPKIIFTKPIPTSVNFVKFLNNIKQDYVLFVDEFEKLFNSTSRDEERKYHTQESFLSFMDGVLTNDHKVLFLLTTNETVSEYLINRPSRIKFMREYVELPEELFNMIVDDKLINKEYKKDLEDSVSLLNLNIDLLISIVGDINLFDRPFSEFAELYNYKFELYKFDVYKTLPGKSERWECMRSEHSRPRHTSHYLGGYSVDNMIKFTKEEIIFHTTEWVDEGEGDDSEEKKVQASIRLVPFKGYSKTDVVM
jgi:hypothetical protein